MRGRSDDYDGDEDEKRKIDTRKTRVRREVPLKKVRSNRDICHSYLRAPALCGGSGRSLTVLGCELEARIETRNRRMNLGVVFCNF